MKKFISILNKTNFFSQLLVIGMLSFLCAASNASASSTQGTIDSTYRYAWGENIGWVDFGSGDVLITDSAVTGNIYGENIGWIVLNLTNTSAGVLSGYAWGENIGWVDFSGVTIGSHGEFTGSAYGENSGWISFGDGSNKVVTDWRPALARQPLTISPTTLNIARTGSDTSSDSIYVSLNVAPASNVTLTPTLSSPNSLTFNSSTLTFTSGNWNTPQNLIVYTVSTSTATSFNLTFTTSSSDANYNNLSANASTTVAITVTNRSSSSTSSSSSSGCTGLCGGGGSSPVNSNTVSVPTIVNVFNQPGILSNPLTQSINVTSSFVSNNSSASLFIPPNTIANPATLEIKPQESVSVILPNNLSGGSIDTFNKPLGDVIFDITLKDNATNTNITNFSTNNLKLTISLPSLATDQDTTKLGLYYLNETTNQWIRVNNAVFDTVNKQVTASLNHLTKFAVFKSKEYVLNTELTSIEDQVIVNNQQMPQSGEVALPRLTAKQLSAYAGKFIADNSNNIFYVDKKTKNLELVTKDNAIKYLAKTALGITNSNLNKINKAADKKVTSYSKKFSGKVLLQVQNKGKLWYVDKTGRKSEVYDGWGLVKSAVIKLKLNY